MILDVRETLYLSAVVGALEEGRLPADAVTDRCPECGQVQTYLHNDDHIVMRVSNDPSLPAQVLVVIACEGYLVINPALVGCDAGNWMDWRDVPEDVNVTDFIRDYPDENRGSQL